MEQKILPEQCFSGLQDTLQILRDAATGAASRAEDRGKWAFPGAVQIDQFRTELSCPQGISRQSGNCWTGRQKP